MRKLGLIGGLSWYSTRSYYEHINRGIQAALGADHSAPLIIDSLDFSTLARLSDDADWDRAATVLGESAARLEAAGATALIICANSMHKVYDRVAAAVTIPVLHIAECVGARMAQGGGRVNRGVGAGVGVGVGKAALLGTRNVMLEGFYREKLIAHDIELLAPDMRIVDALDRIIYDELILGRVTRAAERELKSIVTRLEQAGAGAIVLGCTELEMVVDVDANVLPVYDCTRIHADAAVEWILGPA